jgi:E3 ubiquitin-protein ligase HUWE1
LRTARAEKFHEKILQFFDSFIHGIPTAFQTLANVKGLDIIADLTSFEVNAALEMAQNGQGLPRDYKSKVVDYAIPFYQQSTLRQLFKNTVHMFEHNAGTHDRLLRNLIDTPQILGALRLVIENASTFGSNVWTGALNIVSSFIHNEPTSYQVIGEAGLSKSFLESITEAQLPDELPAIDEIKSLSELQYLDIDDKGDPVFPTAAGILPVGEVMCDIPTAFGAICLNESGMQVFQASGALVKFFDIFLSPTHVRAMEDEGSTAATIGQSFDELSRHHPRLKDQILAAVFNMLRRLKQLCEVLAVQKRSGAKLWEAVDGKMVVAGGKNALQGVPKDYLSECISSGEVFSPFGDSEVVEDADLEDLNERAPAVPFLSTCFKFLEGFLHNNNMCALFCEESGAELILDLATSPSNPYDLVAFPLFSKVTQVLKMMGESRAHLVLPSVIRRTQFSLLALKGMMENTDTCSAFSKFEQPEGGRAFKLGVDGTTVAKSLLNAHLLTHVLGRTLAPPPYSLRHGNQNNHLFMNLNFTDVYVELIKDLSRLHAACLWENLFFQKMLPEEVKTQTDPRPFVMRRIDANGVVEVAAEKSTDLSRNDATDANGPSDVAKVETRNTMLALKNVRTIRYLLSQVPLGIVSFYHSLGQAIVTKRSEPASKQHAIHVAEQLANAVIWELDFRRNSAGDDEMETEYVMQILGIISRVMLRNSYSMESFGTKEALTLVLTKFYVAGGFDKLNSHLAHFVSTLANLTDKIDEEDPRKKAIEAILSFYSQVVRSKCINDASQTGSILLRDRTQPDFFQPGQFLVEIRHAVLPAVSKIWHSQDLDKFTDNNLKVVVDILRCILKAEGEDRALKRSEKASRRVLAHTPEFKLRNVDGLDRLTKTLGFDVALSREALYRCNNHGSNAEAYVRLRLKDDHAPRFAIPQGEPSHSSAAPARPQSSTAGDAAMSAAPEQPSVEMEDAPIAGGPTEALDDQGQARVLLSVDSDAMSDDDNMGTLGTLPADMRVQDLASLTDPRTLEVLGQLRPTSLPARDTQQLFVTIDDLDDERSKLRDDLIDHCLEVLSTQPSLTFELADLIQAAVAKAGEAANPRAEIGATLVSSLMSLQGEDATKESGVKIQAYAHLVALILQDRDFFDSTLDELKEYFENFVTWVKLEPDQKAEDAPWIRTVLLIIERVLAEDEQPVEVSWSPPSAEDPLKPLPAPEAAESVVAPEIRSQLFNALIDILPKVGKDSSLALSVCRVMVILTRRRELAARLSEKHTLGRLFLMMRQLAGAVDDKLQSSFLLILRHMVEDDEVMRQIMRSDIKAVFESHRSSRPMDTTAYIRQVYHLVLREPAIFVEVTQELLEVTRYDGHPHRAQCLVLKKELPVPMASGTAPAPATAAADPTAATDDATATPKTSEAKPPPITDTKDGVIQFLLRELSNFKDVEDKPAAPSKTIPNETPATDAPSVDVEMPDAGTDSSALAVLGHTTTTPVQAKNAAKPAFKAEDHPIYIYRCFILQCLAELVACYNRTKVDFINFSRKSDATSSTPMKPRAGTLNYLLNTLLPAGTLDHRDDVTYRKRLATSHWAGQVLVSLCTKTQERHLSNAQSLDPTEFPEHEPDLTFVRKFVLEHALRSFKDATTSTEPLDQRYSRLLALGELFNRMLNGKVDFQRTTPQNSSSWTSHQHMGRLMYEKNFIGTLTSAIAELDLNFPNAKRAVKYILGPLKQLTELGVHLSQTMDISSSSGIATSADEDDISSATSVSEDEDEREQTPDLFRGSSLGMFESGAGDDEDESDDDDEDDDEVEMYDDGYDDEMEYEEEMQADHGEVVSDDDDDIDGMGEIEGVPGDVEMDVDIVDEEEDSDDTSGDDEDDEDEDEDDDEDELDQDVDFEDQMEDMDPDDENASLGDHDEGWEDDGLEFGTGEDGMDGGSPHGGPLEHMAHVLGVDDPSDHDDPDGLVRLDMGGGDEEFFEDEMAPDDDDEDDEGEEYGEEIVYEPELEDEEDEEQDAGWTWNAQPPMAAVLRGGHPHHHHHHHHRGFNEMLGMMGDPLRPAGHFRTHRGTPNSRDEDGINPLLQRDGGAAAAQRERELEALGGRSSGRRAYALPRGGEAFFQNLVNQIGPTAGGGVINVNVDPGAALGMPGVNALPPMFTIQSRNGVQHALIDIDPNRPWREQMGGRWPEMITGRPTDRTGTGNDETQAVEFRAAPTSARWQEEARMLFAGKFQEKATRILNMLFRALVPKAMEARRIREKEEAERRAAEEKAAEAARKVAEAERLEREAKEKLEREEREAKEREEAELRAAERAAQAGTENDEAADMDGVVQDPQGRPADAAVLEVDDGPAERITVTIRGREVDITSLGIDREYIEALPEDMREEVIAAQFAEQRSQAAQIGEAPSDISREFLEALPREMQQELLRQEQAERRHRERDEQRRRAGQDGNAAAAAPAAQPQDMNNADFMAMLVDPALRQAILMEQDDATLAALPETIQAEARALIGDRRMPRGEQAARLGRGLEAATARILNIQGAVPRADDATREVSRQRRPIAQMLDKAGIATLLRLMFVSLNSKSKTNLHGILSDVCKNTQNRAEVISILLSILQDGTADVSAVERSFAQLSLRAKQPSAAKTPQPLKRSLTGQQNFTASTELSPLNIVQQCLGTLNALSNDNGRVPSFFLSEHETIASQKAKAVKKGKGRESRASKFPLNALLTLLDRKLITENTAVMETLASLLSHVTRPLTLLLRRAKEARDAERSDNTTGQATEAPHVEGSDVAMQEASAAGPSNEDNAGAAPAGNEDTQKDTSAESKKKNRDLPPPEVPEENIRLVVNILAARECPSKTFSDTLDIIKNLSAIPGAKEVFGKELIRQAQELGQALLEDLEELAKQIDAAETGTELQGLALASFSSAGSKQRKLLRVLVALDHLFDPKRMPAASAASPADSEVDRKLKEDILPTLYESATFEKMWNSLSVCLSAIRQRGNMVNVATILLPLIESLMVVCRNSTLKDTAVAGAASPAQAEIGTPVPTARMEGLFFNFTEEHRKILNELIRNNPKLMNGNLAVLAKNSKVLEFDNKRSYFSRKLHDRRTEVRVAHPSLQLSIRRDQVFLDSFKSLYYKSGNEIKYGKLNIRFIGEEGVDAGGVSREWFAAMARQMFNPDYALFNPVASDRTTFHPNTLSEVNPEHLMFFKFIGRIIGKALYENRVLDCHFSRAVYRRILGKSVSLKDMETLDLDYYKSLVWILENDITDVTFETFSVDVDKFGVTETVDLIPNGRNIPVTEENKHEYVRHVVDYRLVTSVSGQLDNFLQGFHEIIPSELISIFNEQELELLISGLPDIDVDDWKNNTDYTNYQPTSPQIQWFWRAVRSFDKEEKAKLLQFVTGTSKVPLNGFKELEGMNGFSKFNIHRDYSNKERLPSSHTCFNREFRSVLQSAGILLTTITELDLPEYESYEALRHQLYTAITAGSEYFGFA